MVIVTDHSDSYYGRMAREAQLVVGTRNATRATRVAQSRLLRVLALGIPDDLPQAQRQARA